MHQTRNRTIGLPVGAILLEVLIASALGLFIFALLMKLFLASQHAYQLQVALIELNQNAKTTLTILSREIKQSGYVGCAKINDHFSLGGDPLFIGDDNSLVVRYIQSPPVSLKKASDKSSQIITSDYVRFAANDILFISDCEKGEKIQVEEAYILGNKQIIRLKQPLKNSYPVHAEIGRLEVNHYFIKKTNRNYINSEPVYALFRRDIYGYQTELVQGIERIKFELKSGISMQIEVNSPPFRKTHYAYVAQKS